MFADLMGHGRLLERIVRRAKQLELGTPPNIEFVTPTKHLHFHVWYKLTKMLYGMISQMALKLMHM